MTFIPRLHRSLLVLFLALLVVTTACDMDQPAVDVVSDESGISKISRFELAPVRVGLPAACRAAIDDVRSCAPIRDAYEMAVCEIESRIALARECGPYMDEEDFPCPGGNCRARQTQNAADSEYLGGEIWAWNNIFPEGAETSRWYAEEAGFTGAYLYDPDALRVTGTDYLDFGIRLFPGLVKIPTELREDGGCFFHRDGGIVHNPYHPGTLAFVLEAIDRQFGDLTEQEAAAIHTILLDSERIVAPPTTRVDWEYQDRAIEWIRDAAEAAGVIEPGDPWPTVSYGVLALDGDMSKFDERGALKTDTGEFRLLRWWFEQGGGPGLLYQSVIDRIRQYVPHAKFTTDPIAGNDSRPTMPAFAAQAAGLDFAQVWFTIAGRADRFPIYSAMITKAAKISGLPVVLGNQLFYSTHSSKPYAHDLTLLSDLLTLVHNPKNGAVDPDTPWGLVHWGIRGVTQGVTVEMLEPKHGDAAVELVEHLEANQEETVGAIRTARDFLDANRQILNEAQDIPPRVGLIMTRGSQYVTNHYEWYIYYHRVSEYAYALLMTHVPFEFITEDADFSRYDLLIVPNCSVISDTLLDRLEQYEGMVTGKPGSVDVSSIPSWIEAPTYSEVGNWPWGDQHHYPLGGHFYEMDAEPIRAWLLDRAETFQGFFEELLGEPEVLTDPEVIVNRLQWGAKTVLYAVNTRMQPGDDPIRMETIVPFDTEISLAGEYVGGTYDPETDRTTIPVSFAETPVQVFIIEPAPEPDEPEEPEVGLGERFNPRIFHFPWNG